MVFHPYDSAVEITGQCIRPPEIDLAKRATSRVARFDRQRQSCFRPRSHLIWFAAELKNVGGVSVYVRQHRLEPGMRDCGSDIHSFARSIGITQEPQVPSRERAIVLSRNLPPTHRA